MASILNNKHKDNNEIEKAFKLIEKMIRMTIIILKKLKISLITILSQILKLHWTSKTKLRRWWYN